MAIKLSILKCPDCGDKISCDNNDTILYCKSCLSTFEYKNMRLEPIKVMKVDYEENGDYYPFWKYEISAKYKKSGFFGNKEITEDFEVYVPANIDDISAAVGIGKRLSFSRKDFSLTPADIIIQPSITSEQGTIIAEYIFLSHIGSNMNAEELNNVDLTSIVNAYSFIVVKKNKVPHQFFIFFIL